MKTEKRRQYSCWSTSSYELW